MTTINFIKKTPIIFIFIFIESFCYGQYYSSGGYQGGLYGQGGDQTLNSYRVITKAVLQDAYASAGQMSKDLNTILPTNQPYDGNPWNYNGTESLNAVPEAMVDWILVELRDATDSSLIIAQRAALLLDNGNIADTNMSASVSFNNIQPGNYYLCLHHRNSLPVMSKDPVAIPTTTQYDFSDTLNHPPYGGGSKALIEVDPGVYAMIGGDVNSDGTLKYSGPGNDRGLVLQLIVNQTGSTSITATTDGYYNEDVNMNGTVKYSGPENDPSIIIQNIVNMTGSASITAIYVTPVPVGVKANP